MEENMKLKTNDRVKITKILNIDEFKLWGYKPEDYIGQVGTVKYAHSYQKEYKYGILLDNPLDNFDWDDSELEKIN
jgi:hypothetical protein